MRLSIVEGFVRPAVEHTSITDFRDVFIKLSVCHEFNFLGKAVCN